MLRLEQTQVSADGLGLERGEAAVTRLAMLPSAEHSTVISGVISAMRSGLSVVRALWPAPLRRILDGTGHWRQHSDACMTSLHRHASPAAKR